MPIIERFFDIFYDFLGDQMEICTCRDDKIETLKQYNKEFWCSNFYYYDKADELLQHLIIVYTLSWTFPFDGSWEKIVQ